MVLPIHQDMICGTCYEENKEELIREFERIAEEEYEEYLNEQRVYFTDDDESDYEEENEEGIDYLSAELVEQRMRLRRVGETLI